MTEQRCDTCGVPATRANQPTQEITKPGDTWRTHKAVGKPFYGCAEHKPGELIFSPENQL